MLLAFSGGAGIILFDRIEENLSSTSTNSVFVDPELSGPDRLCNVFGSVLGNYSGGGNSATDVYFWKIFNPKGELVFDKFGGSLLQTITYTFSGSGVFNISLKVERAGIEIYQNELKVEVVLGPLVTVEDNYLFCSNEFLEVSAIDPKSSNFSDYVFEWKNALGTVIGTQNTQKITGPGVYTVSLALIGFSGIKDCETVLQTSVSQIDDYQIMASQTSVCPDLPTIFSTSPATSGTWLYLKSTEINPVVMGYGNTLQISPNQNLNGVGDYKIIFEPDPQVNPSCLVAKNIDLVYYPQPEFLVSPSKEATDCNSFDGELTIEAITPIDQVIVEGLGIATPPLLPGEKFTVSGLKSGTYSLNGILGNCSNTYGSLIPLANTPQDLVFEIVDIESEKCTPTGKTKGSFIIQFKNPPSTGNFRIINQKGTLVQQNSFNSISQIPISIPGGVYFVEVYSDQNCNIPESNEVNVPSLNQTNFTVPAQLAICESYEFTPQSSESLTFTLTHIPTGEITVKNSGESFTLTQAGDYQLIGTQPGSTGNCPSEKKFTVNLVAPVKYEPILVEEDCFGNRTYKAEIGGIDPTLVNFSWINPVGQIIGTGQFFNTIENGLFKLEVQPKNSEACPILPIEFEIKEPVLSVDVKLSAAKLCEYGPRAVLNLSTTFPEEVTDIEWRRYDASGNIENLPQFKDSTQFTIDREGTYEAAVFSRIPSINKNCELGRTTIQVDLIPNKVTFDIPGDLSICDPYQLIPQSSSPLEFSLTYPDGKVETKSWNEAFTIDQEGPYSMLGYDPDIKGLLCPEQKTFEVTINPPVQFQPVLQNLSCEGIYEYQAQVDNYAPDQVDYFWRDPAGNLVGSSAVLSTSTYGTFTLEVQPKGSIPCQIVPQSFEVATPVLQVATKIIAGPLCPDQPNAALEVDADFTEISTIEWWFTDINNNRIQLLSETNKKEILASNEGTYEVIVKNSFNCILGRDQVLVLRSSDQVRPALEESYQVCPRYEIAPTLNPGNFAQYEWYFEDVLVGDSPTFKPLQIGTYKLIVYSTEGCAYETTFITEEECELKAIFPNAIQPGNPDKPFLIYTNYLIDELEVWIFNRWGEVIFHCKNTDLLTEESTCPWDGYFDGQKIPPGSYAYRLNFKNLEKNISKEQLGSLLVID